MSKHWNSSFSRWISFLIASDHPVEFVSSSIWYASFKVLGTFCPNLNLGPLFLVLEAYIWVSRALKVLENARYRLLHFQIAFSVRSLSLAYSARVTGSSSLIISIGSHVGSSSSFHLNGCQSFLCVCLLPIDVLECLRFPIVHGHLHPGE